MPAPVTFTLSLAPLPVNFEGTLQEWATAVVNRLEISPAEPWSSFQNGGSLGGSDIGPVLYQGNEWRVWSEGLGAYTYHVQNGAGIVDNTVPLSKLTAGTAGSILVVNASSRPAELPASSGTDGQVLTRVSGAPAWATLPLAPGHAYFETTISSDQDLNTTGDATPVEFDTVRFSNGVTFDTGTFQVPVTAGSVWYFYCALQVEDTGAASTDVQLACVIGAGKVGVVRNWITAQDRDGFFWGGLVYFASADVIGVSIQAIEATPASPGLIIAANAVDTRFGGFRIS